MFFMFTIRRLFILRYLSINAGELFVLNSLVVSIQTAKFKNHSCAFLCTVYLCVPYIYNNKQQFLPV